MLWTGPAQRRVETDCACAHPLTGAPADLAALGPWRQAPDVITLPIKPGYTLLSNPLRSGEAVLLNQPALHVLAGYQQPRPLADDPLVRQLTDLALIEPLTGAAYPPSTSTTLVAWLHLTHACNLACRYCHLPSTQGAMNESTIKAAIQALVQVARRDGFRTLKLKYGGGEPTLRFDLVEFAHDTAVALIPAANLRLEEVLLTNGIQLQPEYVAFLREAGIRLMISLDGVAEAHDAARPARNGASTVARVRKAVDLAVAGGMTPHLSITVTRLNLAEINALTDFAFDRGLPFNLNFYRATPNSLELRPDPDELTAALLPVLAHIAEQRQATSLLGDWLDRLHFSAAHDHTCGAGENYIVVDPSGNVTRCHMMLDRPVADLFASDLLAAVRQPDSNFRNIGADDRPICRKCQWRHWCGGGCPLDVFCTAGAWDAPSPYCSTYRALLPELLRLEGWRLLKQAQTTP